MTFLNVSISRYSIYKNFKTTVKTVWFFFINRLSAPDTSLFKSHSWQHRSHFWVYYNLFFKKMIFSLLLNIYKITVVHHGIPYNSLKCLQQQQSFSSDSFSKMAPSLLFPLLKIFWLLKVVYWFKSSHKNLVYDMEEQPKYQAFKFAEILKELRFSHS